MFFDNSIPLRKIQTDPVPLLIKPGGAELILEHAGKDISKPFGHLHPKGTLEHTLSPFSIMGAVDPKSRPKETVQDQDEDEIEERRQALPPAASVLNLSTFEKYAKQLLGEDSRAWVYISGWADDGVCEFPSILTERFVAYLNHLIRCFPLPFQLSQRLKIHIHMFASCHE